MLLLIITIIGGFLRFYNLMWGDGFFFHPDERNMAISITQMEPENALHPHFFAYGQFPTYLAYFSYQITQFILSFSKSPSITSLLNYSITSVPFRDGVLWLRFWSALASTLTIPLVYLITKETIKARGAPRIRGDLSASASLAALFTAFTPGLIQAAHFGTTESLLTFFLMLLIYLSFCFLAKKDLRYLLLAGIASGVALGTKLTAGIFLLAPFLAIFFVAKSESTIFKKIITFLLFTISYLLLTISSLFLSSPYNFLEFNEFLRVNIYEAEVASGKAPVFYTGQFEETVPIVYQLVHIFPYTLGPILEVLGILGFLIIIARLVVGYIQRSSIKTYISCATFLILTASFLAYFLSNAFLFCKWTRFMAPIFPFFAIFCSCLAYAIAGKIPPLESSGRGKMAILLYCYIAILLIILILPGLLFFSIYLKPDIRAEASEWIYKNIPEESYILSETANVVDIPITPPGSRIKPLNYQVISFDFYHLEEDSELFDKLIDHLEKADYIFIPSQRIFAGRLRLSAKYPLAARYYKLLFSDQLGFKKIAHFSRLPDEKSSEETWSVFDHPVIRIYQKIENFSREEYKALIKL